MRLWLFAALLAVFAGPAAAQPGYPTKPIRLVVPFPPGASNGTIARAAGQKLNEALGQPVVVDNRAGAGGSIGAAIVARSPADGYTLMVTSTSYTTNAAVQTGLPFDPVADVTTVAMIGRGPMMIDLIAGRVQVLIASLPSVLPHVKASKLRALAVTSPQRSSFAPGLATVSESGVPGYSSELWWGLFAPARTPAPVIGRLNSETRRFVMGDEMKRLLADAGAEPAALSTAEFGALVKREIAMWTKVVKARGIKAE